MIVRPIGVTYLNLSIMYTVNIAQSLTENWYHSNGYNFMSDILLLSPPEITALDKNLYIVRTFLASGLTISRGMLYDVAGRRSLMLTALVLKTIYGIMWTYMTTVW